MADASEPQDQIVQPPASPPGSSLDWGAWFDKYSTCWMALLLLAFAVVTSSSVYHDTLTTDETDHLEFGGRLLDGTLEHAHMQRMPVTALNALGPRIARALGVSLSEKNTIWLSRLPTIFLSVLLGYSIFVWSRQLYGIRGGLLSLLVFILCPTTIAHSRLGTNDMSCALVMFLSVFFFVRYVKQPSLRNLLVAAAFMGAAQFTKQTALLLFPINLLILGLNVRARWRAKTIDVTGWRRLLKKAALHGFLYVAVAGVILNAGYGFTGSFRTVEAHHKWLASEHPTDFSAPADADDTNRRSIFSHVPIPLPGPYVEAYVLGRHYNKTGQGHGQNYFLGSLSDLGWWYYFPVAFALKTPIPAIILILLALYLALRPSTFALDSDATVLVFSAAIVFLFFTFFCTAQIGVRYLLPALAFLYALVGQVTTWKPQTMSRVWKPGLAALTAWLSISVFSYHPHYISYFNEFCLNRLYLYKYLGDSNLDWGQSDGYIQRHVDAHKGITVNPGYPVAGTVIVNVNNLVGITCDESTFRWLRDEHSPVGHVAYNWVVYEIPSLAWLERLRSTPLTIERWRKTPRENSEVQGPPGE